MVIIIVIIIINDDDNNNNDNNRKESYTNYSKLKYEIAKIWKMKKVEVIPVVVGA